MPFVQRSASRGRTSGVPGNCTRRSTWRCNMLLVDFRFAGCAETFPFWRRAGAYPKCSVINETSNAVAWGFGALTGECAPVSFTALGL